MLAKSSHLSSLEIYLLGRFQIKVEGLLVEEHRWQRRSAKQLIKLLALEPSHQLHREQIIDLLWTDQDPESASNNLSKTIYMARHALEPALLRGNASKFIRTQKQQVILCSPKMLLIDVEEFERLADNAVKNNNVESGEAALRLYRGDLLTEDIYEDWLAGKRELLRILHRKISAKTAQIHAEKGNYERSIEILRKLTAEDSTDEYAHVLLMRLYALIGSKYLALKQFELCCAGLRELGVEPDEETIELKRQIQLGKIRSVKSKDKISSPNFDNSSTSADNNGFIDSKTRPAKLQPIHPRIKQLTFQQGLVRSARFSPDNRTIIYSAAWNGGDFEIYKTHFETGETHSIGFTGSDIYAASVAGEMALALRHKFLRGYIKSGTLACVHFSGGSPRELYENVQWADWFPDENCLQSFSENECLTIVHEREGRSHLEYPVGNVLFETGGWISHPRFSSDGNQIAFIEHQTLADDSGTVVLIAVSGKDKGKKRILSDGWISIQGLAWNKKTDEIWFTAAREGNARSIYAANKNGDERLVYRGTGSLTLHDLSADGTALITVNKTRIQISYRSLETEKDERDISWHDWSLVRDLSSDGKTILFTEAGESGGSFYTAYIRKADGSAAVRLGKGSALALSPDGKSALVRLLSAPQRLAVLPVGTEIKKQLASFESTSLRYQPWACWFPDGEKILFAANELDKGTKLYVQELEGAPFCILQEEGVEISSPHSISPDGKYVAIINSENKICLFEIENGKCVELPGLESDFLPVRWSADGKYLFIRERSTVPAIVYRYELTTAKKEEWLQLVPKDKTGVYEILRVLFTPDGKTYAYSYTRDLSDLILIEGLQ